MGSELSIKVVILCGGRDFGRCPIETRLPTALWPIAGKSALERLLTLLADQGIRQATICSNGDIALLSESGRAGDRMVLEFFDEPLPAGTAGSLRNAARGASDSLMLVLPAAMVSPPDVDFLARAHLKGRSELTIMLNPERGQGRAAREACGIYICSPSVLQYIPDEGYFDIKEGLIPAMLRDGKSIHAATLPEHAGNFRSRQEYLQAVADYLEGNPKQNGVVQTVRQNGSQTAWIAPNAEVDRSARIYGPVVIGERARISEGTIILGPAIIERDVRVGQDSIIANSVLWDGAELGPRCEVQRCLIDYGVAVPPGSSIHDRSVAFKQEGAMRRIIRSVPKAGQVAANRLQHVIGPRLSQFGERPPDEAQRRGGLLALWLGGGLVLIALLWSYWPTLADIWRIWQRSDEYSSGLLVPFLAIYILWSRRKDIAACPIRPSVAWGLLVFLIAQAFRFFGLFYMYGSAERLSVGIGIGAIVLLLFGRQLFARVCTVWLFSFLMLPWPNSVQAAIAQPLQRWATSSAVFCLETVGYDVSTEGNIIHIGQSTVAVAEACNGLRMVTAFFVISGLVVLLVRRTWWEKLIVLASSLPIALLCNTVRLAVTAMAFTVLKGEQWEEIFHDFGGYAMMPLALAAVVAEFWLLRKLTTLPQEQEAVIITRQNG